MTEPDQVNQLATDIGNLYIEHGRQFDGVLRKRLDEFKEENVRKGKIIHLQNK